MDNQERIIRNYDVSFDLYEWLKDKAARERRPVIKQVEVLLEEAKERDDKAAK